MQAIRHTKIPPLDAELLLAHALKKSRLAGRLVPRSPACPPEPWRRREGEVGSISEGRTWLLAHPETPLSPPQLKQFDALVERRKNHEPVAYIIGEKEFYGRPFSVDRRVMIPRPATETLVDEVKHLFGRPIGAPLRTAMRIPHISKADNKIVILTHLFKNKFPVLNSQFSILDIGTGSGCIGITLALELPGVKVICTDISDDALEVAKENAKRHNVLHRITFLNANLIPVPVPARPAPSRSDWCGVPDPFLVVSNPPYVPTTEKLPPDVTDYEPHEALFAGPDGMDVLQPLYEQCRRHPSCIGCVLEMRLEQAKKCSSL